MRQVYHPNIDHDGSVCLNVLREDWKPVLNIGAIIYGLLMLFIEPNPDDPLNRGTPVRAGPRRAGPGAPVLSDMRRGTDAGQLLRADRKQFEQNVQRSLRGGIVNGVAYENCRR